MVAAERPGLSRGSGCRVDADADRQNDDGDCHTYRATGATSGDLEDLDKRERRRRNQDLRFHVLDDEAIGEHDDKAHRAIHQNSDQHHLRHVQRCIPYFLGHMYSRIGTNEGSNSCDLAHYKSNPDTRPASKVAEVSEDLISWSHRSQDPEWDTDSEEANEEEDQDRTLEEWKAFRRVCIKERSKETDRHSHESALPHGWDVARIGDRSRVEDELAGWISSGSQECLPT